MPRPNRVSGVQTEGIKAAKLRRGRHQVSLSDLNDCSDPGDAPVLCNRGVFSGLRLGPARSPFCIVHQHRWSGCTSIFYCRSVRGEIRGRGLGFRRRTMTEDASCTASGLGQKGYRTLKFAAPRRPVFAGVPNRKA